jgi:K(+)-stimulated pyrophosphate-energized sodium pump
MLPIYLFIIIASLFAISFSIFNAWKVLKASPGNSKMQEIAKAIHHGARIFLAEEFKVIILVLIIVALFLYFLNHSWVPPLLFIAGSFSSALAGFLGMEIATRSNVRVTEAARKDFPQSFRLAFMGGEVMGFLVVGIGLFGVVVLWLLTHQASLLINYALGASLVALFMRVGGGIYTKSADVGADLVGKVQEGLPEDDPRNPAVIADQVGDNVGDTAGMGADLFESYVSSIIAVMVLGALSLGWQGMVLPMAFAAVGLLASWLGSLLVRLSKRISQAKFSQQTKKIAQAMERGTIAANLLSLLGAFFLVKALFPNLNYFYIIVLGLASGYLIGLVSQYYTSSQYKPVKKIAQASQFGSSSVISEGLVVGMKSVFWPTLAVATAMILAYSLGGFYGVALASVGLLGTLALNLSSDCYGPIADNAAGIAEYSHLESEVRERAEALDAVGNTTAAMGKGFAIGAAALAALAWLANYFLMIGASTVSFLNPRLIAGLFIGSALVFIFAGFLLQAVSKGAEKISTEVRRQFKEIKGLLEGRAQADYKTCIKVATRAALNGLLIPALMVIATPLLVSWILGLEAMGGVLVGALITAFPMALFLSNSGAAWDNAKKYVEAGHFGGKGSPAHKAVVVGDTIGDPFKDTAGPALNILVKLLGVFSLILVTLFA